MKAVDFTSTRVKNVFNLSFGDILQNGAIDDKANTNNNDIIKTMLTIISIVNEFTIKYPHSKIMFTGSNQIRTALYQRILKNNFSEFSKIFIITGAVKKGNVTRK